MTTWKLFTVSSPKFLRSPSSSFLMRINSSKTDRQWFDSWTAIVGHYSEHMKKFHLEGTMSSLSLCLYTRILAGNTLHTYTTINGSQVSSSVRTILLRMQQITPAFFTTSKQVLTLTLWPLCKISLRDDQTEYVLYRMTNHRVGVCNVLAFVSVQSMENERRHWKILEDSGRLPWKVTESYGS